MKEITIRIPDREAEIIGRIAALEGHTIEEYTLRALRHTANSDMGEPVGGVMGYGVQATIIDVDEGLVAEAEPAEAR